MPWRIAYWLAATVACTFCAKATADGVYIRVGVNYAKRQYALRPSVSTIAGRDGRERRRRAAGGCLYQRWGYQSCRPELGYTDAGGCMHAETILRVCMSLMQNIPSRSYNQCRCSSQSSTQALSCHPSVAAACSMVCDESHTECYRTTKSLPQELMRLGSMLCLEALILIHICTSPSWVKLPKRTSLGTFAMISRPYALQSLSLQVPHMAYATLLSLQQEFNLVGVSPMR